jgi:hypothetical protein
VAPLHDGPRIRNLPPPVRTGSLHPHGSKKLVTLLLFSLAVAPNSLSVSRLSNHLDVSSPRRCPTQHNANPTFSPRLAHDPARADLSMRIIPSICPQCKHPTRTRNTPSAKHFVASYVSCCKTYRAHSHHMQFTLTQHALFFSLPRQRNAACEYEPAMWARTSYMGSNALETSQFGCACRAEPSGDAWYTCTPDGKWQTVPAPMQCEVMRRVDFRACRVLVIGQVDVGGKRGRGMESFFLWARDEVLREVRYDKRKPFFRGS